MYTQALTSLRSRERALRVASPILALLALTGIAPAGALAAPPCGDGASCVSMEAGSARVQTGGEVSIGVRLRAGGHVVASTTSELVLDPGLSVATAGGRADCAVGSGIQEPVSDFRFRPKGCVPGTDCSGVRNVILTRDPVPDGTVLYTCRIQVRSDATPGDHVVRLTHASFSDPNGNDQVPVHLADGVISVDAPGLGASDRGTSATSGGGCQVTSRADGSAALLLLLPLLWFGARPARRRIRG